MMNLLALALTLSSIVAASLFSPPPAANHQLIREAHRLIVVEFERHTPQESIFESSPTDLSDEAKQNNPPNAKLSSIFTDTKKKVTQFEESTADAVKSIADRIKHNVAEIDESVSDTVKSATDEAKKKAFEIEEFAIKVASNISSLASKSLDMAWELGRDIAVFVRVAHLLGFATAFGTCVWVTFVSNHVLVSAMPRQQFGIVQSRVYPVYFRFLVVAVCVALAGHVLGGKERVQGYNLMAVLMTVLFNLVWLEPKATKAMFEGLKLEKEEGRWTDIADVGTEPAAPRASSMAAATAPVVDALTARKEAAKCRLSELKKRVKSLNNYSSFLNVLTLMGLSWHLVYLA